MPLFQPSVVKKYIQDLDKVAVKTLFDKFTDYFGNNHRQQNIRDSKEEQFQEGFLRELFVNLLGYTINPEPNYNLLTEQKNEKDSKKADGAILKQSAEGSNIVAVIELKGTETTDLSKVEVQAFSYKNNQKSCVYVITSNFEKLRFYIDDAIDFEEFNLFSLTEERFQLLYLCIAKDNLLNNIAQQIKEASVSQEDQITKKLYADYSAFKKALFANITELNPQFDKLTLFKKTQKLLDRFLFIFFAEDRLLLPPNSIREIVKQWESLKDLDNYVSLYSRFLKYFGYMNVGFKGKTYDIFAYNGGLLLPDEILDNIKIDDAILHAHTIRLSNYDFDTEVDVNILGHIFEHSLNEIEEVQSALEGKEVDNTKTRRKKDGVFYTPKYITKYIVENTVGALCTEKKKELEINDDEVVITNRKNKKKELLEKIDTYRNWLLKLTICDPACGSGAFLNQALDFLISEHKKLDELIARITNSPIVFADITNSILENNIFGVDINEEAVEIARLSLWLKTAQKGRKLSNLSSNIKCGNSLIDDPTVAGDKAFNWFLEFPQVFPHYRKPKQIPIKEEPEPGDRDYLDEVDEPLYSYKQGSKGFEKYGFDVVIGNPPYVLCQPSNTADNKLNYYKTFKVASYKIDLFHLFYEKAITILKEKGKLGFITPNTYLTNKYIQSLRSYILDNTFIETLVNYNEVVFVDAGVDVATLILTKIDMINEAILIMNSKNGILELVAKKSQNDWKKDKEQTFNINIELSLNIDKTVTFGEIGNTYFGIQAYDRKSSISDVKITDAYLPLIDGADIFRYQYSIPNKYFNFLEANIKSGGDWNIYLLERIVIRQIGQAPIIGFCDSSTLTSNTIYNLYLTNDNYNLKYVLAILNSKFINAFWKSKFNDNKDLFPKIKGYQIKQLPIPKITIGEQKPLIAKAEIMLFHNKELKEIIQKFHRTVQRKFAIADLSNKLQDWYLLNYSDFIKELAKKKIKLSLAEEAEWEDYFNQESRKALGLKAKIDATDKEIDSMVYELYGLKEEEIKVVEGS